MRPQGVIRIALLEAAVRLYEEQGGATWVEIAVAARVAVAPEHSIAGETEQRGIDARLAKKTVHNMVDAGQLEIIGSHKPPGSRHWHALFAPAQTHIDESHDADPTARLSDMLTEVQAFG